MRTLSAFVLFAVLNLPAIAIVDGDLDGISDVWRQRYNATALVGSADNDLDGQSNAAEATAGTDPLSPADIVKFSQLTRDASGLHVGWPSQAGKQYQIQTSANLGATASWIDSGSAFPGTGSLISTDLPNPTTKTFYRIRVTELDSDNDGVSDWEEAATGLNPHSNHSNGLNQPADLQYLTGALAAVSVVTIESPATSVAENSQAPATFTIRRTGGLKAITVLYTISGSATAGSDYFTLSGSVNLPFGAKSGTIALTPKTDVILESPEAVILTLANGANYTVGAPTIGSVLIDDAVLANGDGLKAQFWNHPDSTTNSPIFGAGPSFTPTLTRVDSTVNFNSDVSAWIFPPVNTTYFSSRWTGEVLPEFAQIYTFYSNTDNGGRLWVNGQLLIDNWPPAAVSTSEKSAIISLEAGKRYPIVYEHYNNTSTHRAILSWASSNQLKQVIPQARLFSSVAPQIISSLEELTFIGGPAFSYSILASGGPITAYAAANLPPGLSVSSSTGIISGTPTATGTWQVVLTATNAQGSGSAKLTLTIAQTGSGITRDVWNNVSGANVSSIPLTTAPSTTSTITSFRAPSNVADNYGARIRGYLTAPLDGNYQFWLGADDAAELYISDDAEPVNAWKRAELTAAIGVDAWASAAKTPLLRLKAGNQYYVEVRHKESTGNDHLELGWLKPGQTGTVPSEIVPGYVLSPYVAPVLPVGQSVLFTTNLTAQGTVVSGGYGSASLQLSADKTQAVLRFTYSNLTSPVTGSHVHSGADGGLIIFDIDDFIPEADGSYTWTIEPVLGLTDKDGNGVSNAADVVRVIENGDAYLNVHTGNNPNGEIKGFFKLQAGSQTFTAPAAPPAWSDDHTNANAAARFLQQATFGPTSTTIADVQSLGFDAWITNQFGKPLTSHLPVVEASRNVTNPDSPTYSSNLSNNAWWKVSVTADDQLRQRVAFALSEILVTSTSGPLEDRANTVSDYYDTILANSFGNFRTLLESVTLHPAMGRYLDMLRNDKPDKATGRIPNENYAREIMQLFSIGLNRLHPDGSLVLDSKGLPISTYDQDAIMGFAHVFTGWYYHVDVPVGTNFPSSFSAASNWIDPMTQVPSRHFTGEKQILNNVVLPGLPLLNGVALDPYASHSSTQYNDPVYQALPAQELAAAHDALFNHPNCGPFICRQLIQRLVTSTPSRSYIYRVTSTFNNNGSGVRGDMKAVIRAILLDYEARSTNARQATGFGKQREPVLRITQPARAFAPTFSLSGTYVQTDGFITITSPNHGMVNTQTLTLAFTNPPVSTSPATDGTYSATNSQPITANDFSVRAKDVIGATYSQTALTGNQLHITTATSHGLATGNRIFVKFTSGSPQPTNAIFTVSVVDSDEFDLTMPDAVARSGNAVIGFLKGSYSMPVPVSPATTSDVTIICSTVHGLSTNASVNFDFIPSIGDTLQPADGAYTITVIDPYTFKFTTTFPGGTALLEGTFVAGASTHPFSHSGNVSAGFSNWNMGNTDTDLAQTPLRSPTVFNFYEPDYQFPGELAGAGQTTPEFQLTSDTNVIRQANYLYGGFFNPSNVAGLVSFKSGDGKIGMELSAWMGLRPSATGYWTDSDDTANDNLHMLIRQLGTLLMAGQMTQAMEDAIYANVSNTSNITYSSASGSFQSHRRDRVRAVIHFILTSPQYIIQK